MDNKKHLSEKMRYNDAQPVSIYTMQKWIKEAEALEDKIKDHCFQVGHTMYKVTEIDNGQSIIGEHQCSRCDYVIPFQFDYHVN